MSSSGARKRPQEATDDDAAPAVAVRRQPYRAAKQPRRSDAVPHLPPELWEHIFRFVSGSWRLLRLRLVCRCWRDVISSSPSLMSRLNVKLVGNKQIKENHMDGNFVPAGLPPLVLKVKLRKYSILTVDQWWPAFGLKLRELRLENCKMALKVLYGMLRQTPNLKSLALEYVELSGTGEPDFQLNRLKSLSVLGSGQCYYLTGFEHVFTHLEELTLVAGSRSNQVDILQAIRTLQKSLQALNLTQHYTGTDFLYELCEMKQLRLKSVSLVGIFAEKEKWIRFCQLQPQLEKIDITVDNTQILLATSRMLPNLQSLSLTVIETDESRSAFLPTMPGLVCLSIESIFQEQFFGDQSCPNLKQFKLGPLSRVKSEDVLQFLSRSPNLEHLTLNHRKMDFSDGIPIHFPNLRYLTLSNIQCANATMKNLLRQCPMLEELQLGWLTNVNDDLVRDFCQRLKHLRKLTMIGLRWITDKSAKHIMQHCRKLEELDADFSDEVLGRIERSRKIRIRRRVYSDTEEDDDDSDDE